MSDLLVAGQHDAGDLNHCEALDALDHTEEGASLHQPLRAGVEPSSVELGHLGCEVSRLLRVGRNDLDAPLARHLHSGSDMCLDTREGDRVGAPRSIDPVVRPLAEDRMSHLTGGRSAALVYLHDVSLPSWNRWRGPYRS